MLKFFVIFLGSLLVAANCDLIVGGYTNRPDLLEDKTVKELVSLATDHVATKDNVFLKNIKIIRVQTQVVAGTNYKINFSGEVNSDKGTITNKCQAIIYVNLESTRQVTSVKCR